MLVLNLTPVTGARNSVFRLRRPTLFPDSALSASPISCEIETYPPTKFDSPRQRAMLGVEAPPLQGNRPQLLRERSTFASSILVMNVASGIRSTAITLRPITQAGPLIKQP